jgi:hypothetical protein
MVIERVGVRAPRHEYQAPARTSTPRASTAMFRPIRRRGWDAGCSTNDHLDGSPPAHGGAPHLAGLPWQPLLQDCAGRSRSRYFPCGYAAETGPSGGWPTDQPGDAKAAPALGMDPAGRPPGLILAPDGLATWFVSARYEPLCANEGVPFLVRTQDGGVTHIPALDPSGGPFGPSFTAYDVRYHNGKWLEYGFTLVNEAPFPVIVDQIVSPGPGDPSRWCLCRSAQLGVRSGPRPRTR